MKIPHSSHDTPAHDTPKKAPTENLGDAALDALGSLSDADATLKPAPIEPAKVESAPNSAPIADDAPPAIKKLEAATQDLLMPSESDEPFRAVYWPLEKAQLTDSEIAFYAAESAEAPVTKQSVADFFENAAAVEAWMDDEEKATAKRFQDLVETIGAELEKPQVYRIGEREITAAIIGKLAGGFGGLVTKIVET